MRYLQAAPVLRSIRPPRLLPFRHVGRLYSTPTPPTEPPQALKEYHGPLEATFRRLKVFSLGTLGLSTAFSPFLFIVEGALPFSARCALAVTALATSITSTGIVQWIGGPYVGKLRRFNLSSPDTLVPLQVEGEQQGLEMVTLSLALKERVTRVYDTSFLVPTKRPLATWELANYMPAPESLKADKSEPHVYEETVAETLDKGVVIGRWIVKWGLDGNGTCREVGTVVRYFNVHEELL